jgi:hypothetical protein
MVKDDERFLGHRTNEKKWQTYLSPGESAEDTDDEGEEENEKLQEEVEEEVAVLTLQPLVLEIPELKHNSPISQLTPEPPRKTLSLLMPSHEEDADLEKISQQENDAFMRENFNIVEFEGLSEYNGSPLSKEELKKLYRGENININNEYYKLSDCSAVKKITFPNGYSICIKNKNFI